MSAPVAVHFGAGNIGRGFVGLLLDRAGYELVFADVNAGLIDALRATPSYRVHEVGEHPRTHEVTGFRALNSAADPRSVAEAIADARVVTTAVGPTVLRFIAPLIVEGLRLRAADSPSLQIMACENAIGASDTLAAEVRALLSPAEAAELAGRAEFANTAVDRIVPAQATDAGLDVTVESYFEWVVDERPFGEQRPDIPGVTWVPQLEPYIERKLFTVNTGHATAAYLGWLAGHEGMSEALADPEVHAGVLAALRETKEMLVRAHGFEAEAQEAYLQRILTRFANPQLTDTVRRVGRQPLRKLSRHERFIEPAERLAAAGTSPAALLHAISALLRFDVPEDAESVELGRLLATRSPEDFVAEATGLLPGDALTAQLVELVAETQRAR
ncbi:mannitol-1-phosphate 5-dehydrogenase [Leucobacter massiliensis]|uniref:Mannitol-1-phosphate 5-dehydrogenase n=1 Tax=Leucobacter massiliensis TaxID=1686285 RepID=A0A2S9QQF4_9MICO|nr:mannitol-1-phosphate 5-dehydrogenase [Leucobacter massiliensis]PRI11817.1 mannitol-1-phosphate 5-dehydrogenase [Leucobacter massiliensis]